MSVLKSCHDYYHRHYTEYGHPPKHIYMTKADLDILKDEVHWLFTHNCEQPSPNSVYGMEIKIIGEQT